MTDKLPPEHPYRIGFLAGIVPRSPEEAHTDLVARMKNHNYRPAVIVWQGEIVFGVEILDAYIEAEVQPRFEHLLDDADPWEALAAEAAPALEMNDNARAVTAALASLLSPRGRPRNEENSAGVQKKTRDLMAERFKVSVRLVNYAAAVLKEDEKAAPELRQAVRDWRIHAVDAARVLKKPRAIQAKAVDLVLGGQAKTVKRAVDVIEREIAEAERQAALAEILARPLNEAVTLYVASPDDLLEKLDRDSIDAIITHPPHLEDKLLLYSRLAALAAHALKPTGFMVVVGSGMLLPQMLQRLEHEGLRWIMEMDLHQGGPPVRSDRPYFLDLHRQPLLIFGKPAFRPPRVADFIQVPAPDDLPQGLDRNDMAMQLILERLCRPGQVVCDPIMLNRAATALAALKMGCTFFGATESSPLRDQIHARVAEVEADSTGVEETGLTGGR